MTQLQIEVKNEKNTLLHRGLNLGFNTHPENPSENTIQIMTLLGDQLTEHPQWLDEMNHRIKNFNLSNRKIGPADFNGWFLVDIDFTNSDLSSVCFSGAESENVKLEGAILCEGLRLGQKISGKKLLRLYSKFNKKNEREKVEVLNNIIGFLKPDLQGKNLSYLNLSNLDLSFAKMNKTNLKGAILKGTILPEEVLTVIRNDYILKELKKVIDYSLIISPIIGVFMIGDLKEGITSFENAGRIVILPILLALERLHIDDCPNEESSIKIGRVKKLFTMLTFVAPVAQYINKGNGLEALKTFGLLGLNSQLHRIAEFFSTPRIRELFSDR